MFGRQRDDERLRLDGAYRDVVAGGRRPQYGDVERALVQHGAQLRGEQICLDLQGDLGQRTLQRLGDRRQVGKDGRRGEPDAHQAAMPVGDPAYADRAGIDGVEDAPGLIEQELAGRGE